MKTHPFRALTPIAAALMCAAGAADAQVRLQSAGGGGVAPVAGSSATEDRIEYRLFGDGSAGAGETDADQDQGGTADASGDEPDIAKSLIWDNGEDDDIVAYLSTANAHVVSEVADDCWLKEGLWYDVQKLTVRVGVTKGFAPNFELRFYSDCDGRPDKSLGPKTLAPSSYELVREGTGDLAALNIYDVCYDFDTFGGAGLVTWYSPVHIDTVDFFPDDGYDLGGFGYWLSANNGRIQGRQAQVCSPALLGHSEFVDVDEELCCGICTDMAMWVEGKCCWRVLDQGVADTSADGGLYSPVLSQNAPWVRSYDDFQLADPCKDGRQRYSICRMEAWVATNCDVTTIYAEFLKNACDTPSEASHADDDEEGVGVKIAPTSYEALGIDVEGLPVYRFIWECPVEIVLKDRLNYWLTIYSEQGFGAGKRTVWLFEQRQPCNIRINEARYWNPTIGFDIPTPVSDPALAAEPRQHAFSIWVCEEADSDTAASTPGEMAGN